jgi:hypothetical protein
MSGSDDAAGVLPGPTGAMTDTSPRARRRRLLRKAIFGDWHPYLRDPLDLLRLSFGGAAVVFFVAGSLEYAVRLAGTFLVLVAAQRLRMPRLFDLLFIAAMGLQAWGNAGRLFEDVDWWDNLVHFVIPASSVPVLYVLNWRLGLLPAMAEVQVPRLLRLPLIFDVAFLVVWTLQALGQVAGFWSRVPWWDTLVHGALPAVLAPTALLLLIRVRVLPDVVATRGPRSAAGTVLLVFLIAAGFGTVYEIYEWFADAHFGTHYQPDNDDTMIDTVANDVGGLVGGLWLAAWAAWARARR